MSEEEWIVDGIDHLNYRAVEGVYLSDLNVGLKKLILHDYPELSDSSFVSNVHLVKYRLIFMKNVIDKANKKNDYVRETVYEVTKNQAYETMDVQEEWDNTITFGQKIADIVARFGGSWTFIISFVFLMAVWMAFNVLRPFGLVFDAYPFILLNLALSTLAAIQAPLIMMSQNRSSDYDRLQAKNDYRVNQKSEQGIRLLHTKIDHLVQQDQSDLLEIQKLQTEMLASMTQQIADLQASNQELLGKIRHLERTDDSVSD